MNLDETLTRAIAVRDELTAAIEKAQTEEWLRVGVRVFLLTGYGVYPITWCDDESNRNYLARGNVFRTQAAAERADQRRIVEAELRKLAREAGPLNTVMAERDGWWEVRRGLDEKWQPHSVLSVSTNPPFATYKAAQAAIAAITPERLDLLLDEGE